MNNSVFGQYYLADSIIHKLDPRLKITALLLFSLMPDLLAMVL